MGTTSSTSYTDNGLSPGTPYYYQISAYNDAGESSKSAQVSATTKLDVPKIINKDATSSSITISWSPVNGADGYRVSGGSIPSGSYSELTTTSYTDNGLSSGTTYIYTVVAYKGTVVSEPASVSANTGLNSPANVSAVAMSTSSITVSWSSVDGATGYRLRGGSIPSGSYREVTTTSYTDNGLTPGKTYYYTVTAYKGTVESVESGASATTPLNTPTINSGSATLNSITINWSPVNGAIEYYVYRSMTSSPNNFTNRVGTAYSPSTSYKDEGLEEGTTYYYKVSAFSGSVESPQSAYRFFMTQRTILVPPDPPTDVVAVATSSSGITVFWAESAGAAGYRVYRRESSPSSEIELGTTSSSLYEDEGLSPGTTYYYKVTAYNSNGESQASDEVSATTDY